MKLTIAKLEEEFSDILYTKIHSKRKFNIEVEITKDEENSLIKEIIKNYLPPHYGLHTLVDFNLRTTSGTIMKFKIL